MAALNDDASWFVVEAATHDAIIVAAFKQRGFDDDEARAAARCCRQATFLGNRTHNALKALDSRFKACERWDARRCSGFLVAEAAMDRACELAEAYGTGCVAVDNAFHYLFGAHYVLRASAKGYIAYTTCTGAIPEVVPTGGTRKSMGTNPQTYALPTTNALGFDVCIDWATSVISNGTVKALAREGKRCPEGAIFDKDGRPTTDPNEFHAHACVGGGHKGYSLCLLTELLAAFGGGSLPPGTRTRSLAPASLSANVATVDENVKAVVADILGPGNEGARLPGQGKREAALRSARANGLLFSRAEVDALARIAERSGVAFDPGACARYAE
ncbi:MDH2-like oxidoreductase [Aureococcus anophagefferens]|nr:MDH2-like oxidoreductase [Aureococcus anophagefferens]